MPLKNGGAAQSFTDEHSAEDQNRRVLEITINIPRNKQFRSASETERLEMYMSLWKVIKETFMGQYSDQYTIEYCQDGMPHIHGYICLYTNLCDQCIVETLCKRIFKHLPRTAWKQMEQNPFNPFFKRFKSPAVVINCKEVLHANWIQYMHKQQKNASS